MNNSNRYDVETLARQHQKEISDELATRRLLKQSQANLPGVAHPHVRILRLAPLVALLALLLLYFLH